MICILLSLRLAVRCVHVLLLAGLSSRSERCLSCQAVETSDVTHGRTHDCTAESSTHKKCFPHQFALTCIKSGSLTAVAAFEAIEDRADPLLSITGQQR